METTRLPKGITAVEFLDKIAAGELHGLVETAGGAVLRVGQDEPTNATAQPRSVTLEVLRAAR